VEAWGLAVGEVVVGGFRGWGGEKNGGGWWVSDKVIGNCSLVNRAAVLARWGEE
jgi:hypothetical protein